MSRNIEDGYRLERAFRLFGVDEIKLEGRIKNSLEARDLRLATILDRIIAVKDSPVVSHLYVAKANLEAAMYETYSLCEEYERLLKEAKNGNA